MGEQPRGRKPPPKKKVRYTTEAIEEALRKADGFVSRAASLLGCSTKTIHDRIAEVPRLREVREGLDEKVDDLAEAKLIEKIREGNLPAIMFRLRTKAKHRGYVERVESVVIDDEPLIVEVQVPR